MKLTMEKKALRKGVWSPEEDRKLIAYINRYGIWNWSKMAEPAGLSRSGKSCRLRWMNYLKPGIKHGNYTSEEEETIIRMHKVLGNKWSKIAAVLPGRTDNEVKNHWHTHLKKCIQNPLIKQSTSDHENKFNLSELDLLIPKYDFSGIAFPPTLDELCPYQDTSSTASAGTSETEQKIEEGIYLPSFWENLYLESLTKVFDESGSVNSCCDQWEPEPMNPPFGFYDYGSNDLWSNFSVPAAMDEVFEPIFHF